jgi:hypothetical protein
MPAARKCIKLNRNKSWSHPHPFTFIASHYSTAWRYEIYMVKSALSNKQRINVQVSCPLVKTAPFQCQKFIKVRNTFHINAIGLKHYSCFFSQSISNAYVFHNIWLESLPSGSAHCFVPTKDNTQHTKSCTPILTTSRVQTQGSDVRVVQDWKHPVSGIASDVYSWSTRLKYRRRFYLDRIFVISIGPSGMREDCIKSRH